MVEFDSKYKTGGRAIVELGDLLLFTFDKATNELRLCILQAKYKKERYLKFLNFKADLFQWELLLKKPTITNMSKFCFPPNILNFRVDYDSITAYGIFYRDMVNGDVDLLFTLPKHFRPHTFPSKLTSYGERSFNFRCPYKLGSPNSLCSQGINFRETISTCSIDIFEKQVLCCKIGAPMNASISLWALSMLEKMKDKADDSKVVEDLLSHFSNDSVRVQETNFSESFQSALIVITDSDHFNKYYDTWQE